MLIDPTADYCKALSKVTDKFIGKCVDAYYKFFLGMGLNKADAIWNAIEMTQDSVNEVDLTINFDGPMAQ